MLINPQNRATDPEISLFFQEICSEQLESLIKSPGPDLYKDFYLEYSLKNLLFKIFVAFLF